ncbi:hypothetical protein EDC94DRAFT_549804 [Helicostylum pulchrum]|uniref:Uncharacterized protein n=1 Tax=Helicostylum pulchrum TaxID=562976 RepID=A0ABP9YG92_9FUNG|nr:hypothetical protein EDC94DRAFT_549804 [Helicostylum pulchrum]
MPEVEVVYTIHKFEAENVDEISINVGEKVIVLGKDEGYNDGWWQGRNIRGETGLFPITYTVKQLPTTVLENKIDSLENTISKMKVPSTNAKTIQTNVNKSLLENKSPVEEWTTEQVANWLITIGFDQQIANNFRDQEISGDILLELTLDSLKELQVTTFGKRFKIHSAINVLRQESKKQKFSTATTTEPRVTSPFPETATTYYNKQPYIDDDLVSDYSSVIRNSRKPIVPSRPSLPLDMDLIASSPRLSTLVERQGSISSVHTTNTERSQRPQQQHVSQPQQVQHVQQQQQVQQHVQQQQQRIHQLQAQQQQIQQQQIQRPISHQTTTPSAPAPTTNGSSEWRRNTINNIKPREIEEVKGRYSFMRSSLLPNNKLQSVIPNTSMVRRSEDVSTLAEVSTCPDMEGWLYKQGDKYKTWNKRWFVLKTNNLFYFKSPKAVRMKGIINLKGYRIEVDESIHPGKYCFKVQHERERTFYFYTDFEKSMKEWLKALMKATIARDFATPVMSSSTIPTISLEMARKMRPRPPSTIFYQKDTRSSTPSNYRIHNNLDQQFSLMSVEEHDTLPIVPFSQLNDSVRSRAPSAMSISRQQQQRVMSPDNVSEYSSSRLKDSGFNSAHGANLSRSITESSSNSSTHKSISAKSVQIQPVVAVNSPPSVIFYPHEEDEDLIDPEHMSVIEVNRYNGQPEKETLFRHEEEPEDVFTTTMMKKQQRYVDWVNSNIQKENHIRHITDLRSGEALLDLLEALSQQEIIRPVTTSSQSENVHSMDRVVTAFKFMIAESIELDGACTVRDVLNANSDKTMYMLDSIKYWSKLNRNEPAVGGKKMASGGTFGEDDQCKLRELETENILPPNTFASR